MNCSLSAHLGWRVAEKARSLRGAGATQQSEITARENVDRVALALYSAGTRVEAARTLVKPAPH
jgi:hypothetical protein